ncbi:hypothetical protein SLA2020_350860 [Shorea laevis]
MFEKQWVGSQVTPRESERQTKSRSGGFMRMRRRCGGFGDGVRQMGAVASATAFGGWGGCRWIRWFRKRKSNTFVDNKWVSGEAKRE